MMKMERSALWIDIDISAGPIPVTMTREKSRPCRACNFQRFAALFKRELPQPIPHTARFGMDYLWQCVDKREGCVMENDACPILMTPRRFATSRLSIIGGSEISALELIGHLPTKLAAVDERVIVMESRVHTGPEDFIEEVVGILKAVCVRAVLERQTVNDNMHLGSTEVARNQV
jgi:hypothetical protein